MQHIDYTYTHGMGIDEIESRLQSAETGVLSLSRDNDAYAIPLVHYYDGDDLYFRIGSTAESMNRKFRETTKTACYVLYDVEETDDPEDLNSWSIHITGQLVELPKDEYDRFDTATINRHFSPIRVFDEAIDDIEIAIVKLNIDTITGRSTSME